MTQNLIYFGERERQQRKQPGSDEVIILTAALSGDVLLPAQPTRQQPLSVVPQPMGVTDMEVVMEQSDGKMADGTEAQQSGSKGPTEDANTT